MQSKEKPQISANETDIFQNTETRIYVLIPKLTLFRFKHHKQVLFKMVNCCINTTKWYIRIQYLLIYKLFYVSKQA
jgi:hypothetical protein